MCPQIDSWRKCIWSSCVSQHNVFWILKFPNDTKAKFSVHDWSCWCCRSTLEWISLPWPPLWCTCLTPRTPTSPGELHLCNYQSLQISCCVVKRHWGLKKFDCRERSSLLWESCDVGRELLGIWRKLSEAILASKFNPFFHGSNIRSYLKPSIITQVCIGVVRNIITVPGALDVRNSLASLLWIPSFAGASP